MRNRPSFKSYYWRRERRAWERVTKYQDKSSSSQPKESKLYYNYILDEPASTESNKEQNLDLLGIDDGNKADDEEMENQSKFFDIKMLKMSRKMMLEELTILNFISMLVEQMIMIMKILMLYMRKIEKECK